MTDGTFGRPASALIDFMSRFTASEQFNRVFQEGMGLVEETANYLDGQGRLDARGLDRHSSIAYATESMRLTTRLMQLASWLLLQRAISAGELTEEAANQEKHRINLDEIGPGNELKGTRQMPAALSELVERSLRLHTRIVTLESMITERNDIAADNGANPVNDQIDRISAALGARKVG